MGVPPSRPRSPAPRPHSAPYLRPPRCCSAPPPCGSLVTGTAQPRGHQPGAAAGMWEGGRAAVGVPLRRFPGRLLLLFLPPRPPVPGTRCPCTHPGGPAPPQQQHGPGVGGGAAPGPAPAPSGLGHHRGWGTSRLPEPKPPAKCALAAGTNSAEDDCGELWLPVAVAVCVTTVVVVALPGVLESITSGVGSGASRVSRGAVQAKWDTDAYITPAGQKYSEEPAGRSAAPELKPCWLGNSVYVTRVKWVSVCSKDVAQALTLGYAFSLLRFYWYS